MNDKELTAFAIGPDDIEFRTGIYPVSIPQQGKELKVLVIHSSEMDEDDRKDKPEGWYFSLETNPYSIWGTYDNAKSAFFGALEKLAQQAMTEIVEAETIDIKPIDATLH